MITSEYTMSHDMAKELLKLKKNKKQSIQKFLCDYVNNEINPLYTCTKVLIH